MRRGFVLVSLLALTGASLLTYYRPATLWLTLVVALLAALGFYDLLQKRHTIRRNFPLLGRLRYFFELIAPELHQYFVESDVDGLPFSRLQRNYIYKRAKKGLETHPFGTELNVYQPGYYWMSHSMYPREELSEIPRVHFGGKDCRQPYMASIFNISAMSFGALGKNAVAALNKGAKLGNFFQNTGEGGVSPYHLKYGGDLVWQIGTAYFGCRDEKGNFSEKIFAETAPRREIKMIEIKISQGAKPGLGGVLPATKNTEEIAKIRRLTPHKMVHSPPAHQTFSDAKGLLRFVKRLRELSGGKPVGFKLCIGSKNEFIKICEAMLETGLKPDFITVDGGEGGTGAAPMEFSDSVGMPLDDALVFVVNTLIGFDLKKEIRVIASCKVVTGFDIIRHLAIGADACNCARGMMFALGCIQALECDTNNCPTGIATHKPALEAGLVESDKGVRVANYHKETVKSALAMLTAAGLDSLSKLDRSYIYKRLDQKTIVSLNQLYPYPERGHLLRKPKTQKTEGPFARKKPRRHHMPVETQKQKHDYPSRSSKEEDKAEDQKS
jgi:glutamate synthase domain-containing protein 2